MMVTPTICADPIAAFVKVSSATLTASDGILIIATQTENMTIAMLNIITL
jgi:hypothetical protein